MNKRLALTSFLGMTAVILGAFGAHALKHKLSIESMQSFETAVRYQMYHVLALLFINISSVFSEETKRKLTIIFVAGIAFFSGSIYAMKLLDISAKYIWFITPLGGLLLIFGWGFMGFRLLKKVT